MASLGSFEELIFIAGLFANSEKQSTYFLGKRVIIFHPNGRSITMHTSFPLKFFIVLEF